MIMLGIAVRSRSGAHRPYDFLSPHHLERYVRKLTLRKEVLTELTSEELGLVVGAGTEICLTDPCITRPVTGIWCLAETAS